MQELACVNGKFGPIGEATVSIEDRGFQFGDGVYEVIVAYGGRLFLFDAHMDRLQRSLSAIGMHESLDVASLRMILEEGVKRSAFPDTMAYIQITRGVAPRNHAVPNELTPTIIVTFKELTPLPEALRQSGARVMTTPEIRWAKCFIKAITLLPNCMAKTQAQRQGLDEAIFVTSDGFVREATTANVYIVNGDVIRTPKRNDSILHGCTQGFLAECARAVGSRFEETDIRIEELRAADEVFLSSTRIEVLGVREIDGQAIGGGATGAVTRRLYDEFSVRSRDPVLSLPQ